MNILTFDIEEWYIEKHFHGGRNEKYALFDKYLDDILELLSENNLKATFFCVGKLANEFPHVIKKIIDAGHEIGCHSNEHLWLTKMTPEQLRLDTSEAIKLLEDVTGKRVVSYRAPAFSIGESNKWVFEILAECGIERDSSIFPAVRDFGGFNTFPEVKPCIVETNGCRIKEFPITITNLFGKELAYSGGGYFRLFPYQFIRKRMNKSDYGMCYFHIGDLIYEKGKVMTKKEYEEYFREPGTLSNRIKRYIKSNLGTRGAFNKMKKLISSLEFTNLEYASNSIIFDKTVHL